MNAQVVIGLGFGDEGKGLVTSYLVSEATKPLVVRFSGGHQAGHTVVHQGVRHVFANFGSGTLHGAPTYWTEDTVVDPIGISNELKVLLDKIGFDRTENIRLYINGNAKVVTPYDVIRNQRLERMNHHGSCGVGFGTTIQRNEDGYSLTFKDLFSPVSLNLKLQMISEYYREKNIGARDLTRFKEAIMSITGSGFFPSDVVKCVDNIPLKYGSGLHMQKTVMNFTKVIFEGSQGLLLDKDIGFFPHVTRSNVDLKATMKSLIDINAVGKTDVYYVTRAYQTRHGNGPMTNEDHELELMEEFITETNQKNESQGEFRRTVLDLDLLLYGLKEARKCSHHDFQNLVITCLDHLKKYKYTYQGKLYECRGRDSFIAEVKNILKFDTVYISEDPSSSLKEWKERR